MDRLEDGLTDPNVKKNGKTDRKNDGPYRIEEGVCAVGMLVAGTLVALDGIAP